MALILTKESPYSKWYEKNKEWLSQGRKQRYAQDAAYRQRALEASRKRRRGESTTTTLLQGLISVAEAAERIGIGVSTLHEWRRKGYFLEPKHYAGRLWFSQQHLLQLGKLKEFLRVYGRRPWSVKRDRLKELVAAISANWD
jgi:MerR-like DNA binding protein